MAHNHTMAWTCGVSSDGSYNAVEVRKESNEVGRFHGGGKTMALATEASSKIFTAALATAAASKAIDIN